MGDGHRDGAVLGAVDRGHHCARRVHEGDRRDYRIPPATTPTATPEQVLAARFARGEIDETEYRARLAVLRDHARR
jgi:uncharacterized membrane protein